MSRGRCSMPRSMLWEGDGFADGQIDLDLWEAGYETMVRLGFIDGSVPIDEMVAPEVIGAE